MTVVQFKELIKKGNSLITSGFVEISVSNQIIAALEIDDIVNNDNGVTFSYADRANDMEDWRGERAPFFGLSFKDIVNIEQVSLYDNLFGKYQIRINLKNMYVNFHFDIKKDVNIKKYGLLSEVTNGNSESNIPPVENTKLCIDAIHSHKGTFIINVNAGDFVQPKGFEIYNLVFSNVKPLRQNELLSFDNSTMQPIRFTDKNVPVYSMDFSTNFYLEIKNIVSTEEIDAEEYADVFEYPTTRIFNLHMNDETIITMGMMED